MRKQNSKTAREEDKADEIRKAKRRERKEQRQKRLREVVAADPSLRRLVTETEAAALLATTPGSLRYDRWAIKHGGIPIVGLPFVSWGRRGVRYDLAQIEAAIAERTVRSEAAAGGA